VVIEKQIKRIQKCSCAWQYTPGIPALGRLRQEDHKFKASLVNLRPYFLPVSKKSETTESKDDTCMTKFWETWISWNQAISPIDLHGKA
jgi:hypothetical protein